MSNILALEKYLDELEEKGKFLERTVVYAEGGGLLLKLDDKVICDTVACGNLVNSHQINDIKFLRHAVDICRLGIAIASKKPVSIAELSSLVSSVGDLMMSPISPIVSSTENNIGWRVMFGMYGWQELEDAEGNSICHNRSSEVFHGFLYWVLATSPVIYDNLVKVYKSANALSGKPVEEITKAVVTMADEYVNYFCSNEKEKQQ